MILMLLSQLYKSLTAIPHSVPLPLADPVAHPTATQKLMLYYLFYAVLSKSLSVF